MKDELLIELSKNQDKLRRILKTCPPTPSMDDTLQDWLLYVFEKDYKNFTMEQMFPDGKLNEGFIYVCMKNFIFNRIKKDSYDAEKLTEAYGEYMSLHSDTGEGHSLEEKIAYDTNMDKLKELTKDVSKKDYEDILKLTSGKLLSTFRDKDGNVDMKSYQARRYYLSKIVDSLKEEAKSHKYLTADDIDEFAKFN